jgi:hypothetical protein
MNKTIKLVPRLNIANQQISFQLKKKLPPKDFQDRLPQLKSIKIKLEDFDFDKWD